jgi:hypothetical protein
MTEPENIILCIQEKSLVSINKEVLKLPIKNITPQLPPIQMQRKDFLAMKFTPRRHNTPRMKMGFM